MDRGDFPMSSSLPWGRTLAALLAFAIGGCAARTDQVDTQPRVEVSGTVTLDGKPLPAGTIQFDPEAGEAGASSAAEVAGGKFAIERSQGLVPGKYRISISSHRPRQIKPDEDPGAAPAPRPETIPARYNTRTTLSKEVTADGPNQFDFALATR
jgi:hypothetical protein